ncbi:MAG TPA: hypothetical protein VGB17_10065 [Pyrinomonadaceae bacterium]|jgi:hypothetical protein
MSEAGVAEASRAAPPSKTKSYLLRLASAPFLFLLGFYASLISGFIMADEGWNLQVASRVLAGETLYRDIFFGATPLAVYLNSILLKIFGTELLVLKAFGALLFVFYALLADRIAEQLCASRGVRFCLALALLIYCAPGLYSSYSALSILFFLACLSATLSWQQQVFAAKEGRNTQLESTALMIIAGAAAGFCFASKQNTGLVTLVALMLTIIPTFFFGGLDRRQTLNANLLAVLAFILAAGIVLVPVWSSGGMQKFLDYGFTGKGRYLNFGAVSYFETLRLIFFFDRQAGLRNNLRQIYQNSIALLPLSTFLLLSITLIRVSKGARPQTVAVMTFACAAFLYIFPRVDSYHLALAAPALLIGLAHAWSRLGPQLSAHGRQILRACLCIWLVMGLYIALIGPLRRFANEGFHLSTLRHFRGVPMQASREDEIRRQIDGLLKAAEEDGQVFIISRNAGFYYLASGLKNPTPFDYPYVTAFGQRGEAEVIESISQHRLSAVCLDQTDDPQLQPRALVKYVQENMKRGDDLGGCTMYHASAAP